MSTAAEQIRAEIGRRGAIPFARFMELALYCPLCGYYEKKKDTTGKRGDFYTSVSVGPLFGELLAFQFAAWAAELGTRNPELGTAGIRLVEAGAHDGRLAADILNWLQARRSDVFAQTEYWILEPSPTRQSWQRETLAGFGAKVRWIEAFSLPVFGAVQSGDADSPFTICFANELLDALPVHRLGWDAVDRDWFEWGVTVEGANLAWTRLRLSVPIPDWPAELLSLLPDGFMFETCPAAENWWRHAAAGLPRGKLLTFDYGFDAPEMLSPQRTAGTLRAYHHHRPSNDLLALPGEQDLTAHVNFSAIRQAGEAAGLRTEADTSQAGFLTGIAQSVWRDVNQFGVWTPERTRQFHALTHPDHLGRAFRVLIQSK